MPASYYRPFFLVWLRLLYVTLGQPRAIWHISSVLLHLAVIVSVFLLALRLSKNWNGTLLATALFAIHPVNVETVAWVSAVSELLLTLFLVLCLYYYAARKNPISIISLLFATLAIFTKETGIVAIALILAYEWGQSTLKRAVAAAVPYLVPILLYISLRTSALSKTHVGLLADMSGRDMVMTWPRVLWLYAAHLLWPVHLGLFYDVPVETRLWPILLLLVTVPGVIVAILRCGASTRLGAAWFVITLAPTLALPYLHADNYVHDHYLYLPFVGLVLMTSGWLSRIRWSGTEILVACAVCVACCLVTMSDLPAWKDQTALFIRAIESAPQNPHAKNNLAVTYMNSHREADALPLLEQAIALSRPGFYGDAYYNLASCYQRLGRHEEALQYTAIWQQFMAQQAAQTRR
jgi:tetratricopeptide (TPR) repeat protein